MRVTTGSPCSLRDSIYRIPHVGTAEQLPAKEIVGSKAHNLMRMARRGLPVPQGFVLGTQVCRDFMAKGRVALDGLEEALDRELHQLGSASGRYFGDPKRPLLVSVRSGAAVSMPGMMETVLNIGLNQATLRGLIRMTGNPRLAQDCRRRLMQQYGEVVHGIASACFEKRLRTVLDARQSSDVEELDTGGLAQIADAFEEEFVARAGEQFPTDPRAQLASAIDAVLRSWSSERAQSYRRLNGIRDDLGTAVTIQTMVFGNWGPASGAGVGFTRNPANGSNEFYVDYLSNAQGEDVVAGRRSALGCEELERRAPQAWRALLEARHVLENEFADMQDFEFTVEEGRLLLLQARSGKRTPLAALKIAHDLAEEKLISTSEALARIDRLELDGVEDVRLVPKSDRAPLARGTPASTGVAVGAVAFDPQRVGTMRQSGRPVILVRETAETSDIEALAEAAALVTAEGARTSHAAVVARQLGKVCIVGCEGLSIGPSGRNGMFGGVSVEEGDIVSVDGATGEIFRGEVEISRQRPTEILEQIRHWRTKSTAHQAHARKKN